MAVSKIRTAKNGRMSRTDSSYFPEPTAENKAIVAEALSNGNSSIPTENTLHKKSTLDFNFTRVPNLVDALMGYGTFLNSAGLSDQLLTYVLVFAYGHLYDSTPRHALCVKKRPGSLHAGLWNLPGGKVQKDEAWDKAALRELEEEIGRKGSFPQLVGAIMPSQLDLNIDKPFMVLIYRTLLNASNKPLSFPVEQTADWKLIKSMGGKEFVPSVAVICSLIAAEQTGFIIQDTFWDVQSTAKTSQAVVTLYHEVGKLPNKKKERFTT